MKKNNRFIIEIAEILPILLILAVGFSISMYALFAAIKPTSAKLQTGDARYSVVYRQQQKSGKFYIIEDKNTGKQYLFVQAGYAGGLTEIQ